MNISNYKIGIIGSGQLGKMLCLAAKAMGFYVKVYSEIQNSPAGQIADEEIIGSYHDKKSLQAFVENNDITTYELENIATIKNIFPSKETLEVIQNKYQQKLLLEKHQIAQPSFKKIKAEEGLDHFPNGFVQKSESGGYDGKGVIVIKNSADLKKKIANETSYLEELIDFEKEIAVNIAKSTSGEIKIYPVTEMAFNHELNLCDMTITPAQINKEKQLEAQELAKKVMNALPENSVGIFAIEMFLTKNGEILVNEIAPRPHNSAHYSIEGSYTSQFEQHIRAITGLPLGSTELIQPSVMVNILGEKNYTGPVKLDKIKKLLEIDGLNLHIYGKKESRPGRKIGHLTILDQEINSALEKAKKAKQFLN